MRIEGFDVSNIGPEHTVASMVVFEGGAPKKSDYRRFRIRGDRSGGPRRLRLDRGGARRGGSRATPTRPTSRPHDSERDESFASLPDLIVIDGGKGQLAAGMRALAPLVEGDVAQAGEVTVIGLAKRIEEVFVPGALGAAADPGRLRGAAAAPAGPRRGAPVRDRAPPRPPRPGDDPLAARRAARRGAGRESGRC